MPSNRDIQRKRMLTYFIEATAKIIEDEGFEKVTIRRVADIAGYNSATLYNYFEDLNHLIFFASMKYLKDYTLSLAKEIDNNANSYEKSIKTWEIFCYYSFKKPKIFYNIFFEKHSNKLKQTISEYYSIFPEEFGEHSIDIAEMLKGDNIINRNKQLFIPLVKDGYIDSENLEIINEATVYFYQGLLYNKCLNPDLDSDELTKKMLSFIEFIID